MEYRDVHSSTDKTEVYLKLIGKSEMSKIQKEKIKRFVELLQMGKIGQKVQTRRIASYLQFLLKLQNYFGKDLDKVTEKEAEQFYKDLQEDKIKKQNGMPFAQPSKDEFVKTLKRYLGWAWGKDSKKYLVSLRWMKDNRKKSNKRAITIEQAEKVLNSSDNIRNKCLFMFLFDSGARIEEALNVRLGDLTKSEKGDRGYFMVHLRGTKTEEADRTIAIPLSTGLLNAWWKAHPTKDDKDFLFPLQYDNARKIIKQLTEPVLSFELKPHELRHSSATHYIQNGGFGAENIGGFYYRYGWKFGSEEALGYIKMHLYGGEMGQEKVVKHIVSDKIESMEAEIEKLKKTTESLKEFIQKEVEIHTIAKEKAMFNILNKKQKGKDKIELVGFEPVKGVRVDLK